MFDTTDSVFKTPSLKAHNFYNGTIGEFLYSHIRMLPSDFKVHVNADTGDITSANEFLKGISCVISGLKALNLKKDCTVALIGSYGTNQISVFYGTIIYGATMFPIDPTLKSLEIQHLLKHQVPEVVFTETSALEQALDALKYLKLTPNIFTVDSNEKVLGIQPFRNFIGSAETIIFQYDKHNQEIQVPLVLASSGTTGKPKIAARTNKDLFTLITVLQDRAKDLPKSATSLSLTQLFWISGIRELLKTLIVGITYLFTRYKEPANILSCIEIYKPYFARINPFQLTSMLNYSDFGMFDLSSLKEIMVGGTTLPLTTIDRTKKKWQNYQTLKIYQVYGTTEINCPITKPTSNGIMSPFESAGYLSDGFWAKVINDKGDSLIPNEIGEILLKPLDGNLNYVNDSEAQKKSFDSQGFYKTGDIGYITKNGLIYITGRQTEYIISWGRNIPPIQVEEVILEMEGVSDVAVVGIPHEAAGSLVCAAVVKADNSVITEEDIIKNVADKLTACKKLSAGVKFIPAVPYSTNGKKLRNKVLSLINDNSTEMYGTEKANQIF